jgi:sugar phosphate permease
VLALTVAAYMLTYMDRVVISSAVPAIQKEFGFSIVTMGWILGSFRWAYSIFQIPVAWFGDRYGPRRALTAIVLWWSLLTSATTMAWSAASMIAIRFLFGAGEAGAFPIATRSLSRWMLPSERGFAQGITHAGSRLGAALTPALVAVIIANFGWRTAFLSFGSIGILWASAWFFYYRDTPAEHPRTNAAERQLIASAIGPRTSAADKVPWKRILSSSQMWILALMYFCYAYPLGIYLDWFPKYLNAERGFSLEKMGFYASLPLFAAVLGDLAGGWVSDIWARYSGLRSARKGVAVTGFLISGAGILAACLTPNALVSVAWSCVAMFGLELTVGVAWAVPLDIGGDYAGSVSAVMNSFGNMGGAVSTTLSGYLVKYYGWTSTFLVMAALTFVAAILFTRIDAGKKIC